MSNDNQEQENIGSVTDNHADVDKSKRKFSKAGMVAPVIMTLASKPVFAVQGLSNMLSTHGSATCRGDNFVGGMDPVFWADKNNKAFWTTAGFDYKNSTDSRFGFGSTSLSDILNSKKVSPSTETLNLIAGMLNAHYYANFPSASYFMTVAQYDSQLASFDSNLGSSLGDLISSFYGRGTGSCAV